MAETYREAFEELCPILETHGYAKKPYTITWEGGKRSPVVQAIRAQGYELIKDNGGNDHVYQHPEFRLNVRLFADGVIWLFRG